MTELDDLKAQIETMEAEAEAKRVASESEIGTLKATIAAGKPPAKDDPIVPMRVSTIVRITTVLQQNPSPATPVGEIVQLLALIQKAVNDAQGGFIPKQTSDDIKQPPTMDEVLERGRKQKEAADAIAGRGPPS